ncbi:MAG: carboxypeptidase-like regulatory domain-containing protein [Flavobacterium sp.]
MKQKINIAIPNPCHENWQVMSATEKGKFCASCQKNVFDFTTASDRQIATAYKKDKNLCGRFLNTQLDRDLIFPKEKSTIWLATTSAIISFLALGNQEVTAQETVKTEQTDKRVLLGKPAPAIVHLEKDITGIVSDASSPLPGVNVVIKGTQIGTQTNFDGFYTIKAQEGETLVFSFMGMGDKEIIVGRNSNYNIKLQDDVKGQIYVKHNFIEQIFHKIGNWFR